MPSLGFLGVAIVLLGVGVVIAVLVRKFLFQLSEAATVGLILLPAIIYGLQSDLVSELSGFGFTAKFKDASKLQAGEIEKAGTLSMKVIEANKDFSGAAFFQECTNYFVLEETAAAKPSDPKFISNAYNVGTAIKAALLCRDFLGVVVVDKRKRFIGLFPRERFESLLAYPFVRFCIYENEHCSEELDVKKVLVETELGSILRDPGVRADSTEAEKFVVRDSDNLTTIVSRPDFSKASVFAVVDNSGTFQGLLPKQIIYDRLLSVLLKN